jgi:hypothetical protein
MTARILSFEVEAYRRSLTRCFFGRPLHTLDDGEWIEHLETVLEAHRRYFQYLCREHPVDAEAIEHTLDAIDSTQELLLQAIAEY